MVSHCWSSKSSFPARHHKDVPRVERLLVPFVIIVPTQAPGDLLDGRRSHILYGRHFTCMVREGEGERERERERETERGKGEVDLLTTTNQHRRHTY